MTPQSQLTVVAPIAAGRESGLSDLLATLNSAPGVANPDNPLVPFGKFTYVHFARFAILNDLTFADIGAYGPTRNPPVYLAFLADCDGPSRDCLTDFAQRAGDGLRTIFSHCEDFAPDTDLFTWMLAHNKPIAASYVNWVGRTVTQITEESALQKALTEKVDRSPLSSEAEAEQRRLDLFAFVQDEVAHDRLSLTEAPPTPLGWRIAKLINAAAGLIIIVLGVLALPLLILLAPLVILMLRSHEKRDPEICPRPDSKLLDELHDLEDHDVTNQYTALGTLKPGWFRRSLTTLILKVIQFTCRHVFTHGYLARVQTIHFARWVLLDDTTRVLFTSNYDGGHQAYMDDFINKVAWGLNIIFSNGVGWPQTDWLICRGARREDRFKYFQRRHQLPTQVWYKAYPGLTLVNLERNTLIRRGLERRRMSNSQALTWLQRL